MKELENLLNSLIWRGWKPFGEEAMRIDVENNTIIIIPDDFFADDKKVSIRDISSLDSGLWQFVCRNKLYKKTNEKFRENVSKVGLNTGWFTHNHQFRLLESALLPEEELGQFLIDNIIVKGPEKN
ncbi:MAG: hypothetical protein HG424_000855 [candidate division SR1 bacterium]|nr:hypothetical protein [candidate division SR1 bacterium]